MKIFQVGFFWNLIHNSSTVGCIAYIVRHFSVDFTLLNKFISVKLLWNLDFKNYQLKCHDLPRYFPIDFPRGLVVFKASLVGILNSNLLSEDKSLKRRMANGFSRVIYTIEYRKKPPIPYPQVKHHVPGRRHYPGISSLNETSRGQVYIFCSKGQMWEF